MWCLRVETYSGTYDDCDGYLDLFFDNHAQAMTVGELIGEYIPADEGSCESFYEKTPRYTAGSGRTLGHSVPLSAQLFEITTTTVEENIKELRPRISGAVSKRLKEYLDGR